MHSHSMSAPSDSSMSMMSIFQISSSTPLYSTSWTPTGTGSYAGTCIFLIVLATIFRGLMAGKHILEHHWLDTELNRRYATVRGKPTVSESISTDSDAKTGTLITERGVEEDVRVVRRTRRGEAAWRFSVDLPRAAYVTVMAGVGYLL